MRFYNFTFRNKAIKKLHIMKTIELKNENCKFIFNLECKSIKVIGKQGNLFYSASNDTLRGVKKTSLFISKNFNESTSFYSILEILNDSKIRMKLNLL